MHAVTGTGRLIAGRYRLQGPVGRGAMGIVWRGRDELLHRDVAVKQVQITALTLPAEAEVAYQRTLREARTAARLSHPAVVTVFDVVEEDGSPWIIMEFIGGRSLEQVIAEDGPLPPLHAAELGSRLLGALETAHAAGVLHRDVKPSNVLIAADGRAVLTDFGIAMFAEDPGITQVGMVVGTPGFTAPERVRGGSATPASDLWSLGATLYAAVEGRGPFERPGGSMAIIAGVASEEAPRAPSAGPLVPVIDALLSRDPAARPDAAGTAALLADAVAAGATTRPVAADQGYNSLGYDSLGRDSQGRDSMSYSQHIQPVLGPGSRALSRLGYAPTRADPPGAVSGLDGPGRDAAPVDGAIADSRPGRTGPGDGRDRRGPAGTGLNELDLDGASAAGRAAGPGREQLASGGRSLSLAGPAAAGLAATGRAGLAEASGLTVTEREPGPADRAAGATADQERPAAGRGRHSMTGSAAAGTSRADLDTAGVDPAGLDPAGLDAADLDQASLDAAGLELDWADAGAREPAASFLDPPDFDRLRMPGPGDELAGVPDPFAPDGASPAPASNSAGTGYQERTAGLPEFMDAEATGADGPDGPPGSSGPAGPAPAPPAGPSRTVWARHWRIATAGGAIAAIVVAAVIGLGVYSGSLAAGSPDPQAAPSSSGPGTNVRIKVRSSPRPGTGSRPTAGAGGAPVGGGQGGDPSPSHSTQPSQGTSPSPSTSPTHPAGGGHGSKSPSPGSGLGQAPAGYQWHTVKAATLGTLAGFAIAAPDGWQMQVTGKTAYLADPGGHGRVTISLHPWTYAVAMREARQLQKKAKAKDPGYRFGAVRPTDFMGVTAAVSRFSWQPVGRSHRTAVLSELVTLATAAGVQPYQMTLSVGMPYAAADQTVYQKMLSTFQPLT